MRRNHYYQYFQVIRCKRQAQIRLNLLHQKLLHFVRLPYVFIHLQLKRPGISTVRNFNFDSSVLGIKYFCTLQ